MRRAPIRKTGTNGHPHALTGRLVVPEFLGIDASRWTDPPPAAYLTALRQMEELLRIAGPRSRVGAAGGGGNQNGGSPRNPFNRNGHRARA